MKSAAHLALGWLWLSGCTISAVSEAEDTRLTNTCSVDSDCGAEESCNDGLCQPFNGDLEALLIEITPPADSEAQHVSFVSHFQPGFVPTSGGELKLPPVQAATVTGSLQLSQTDNCYPTLPQDGAVPLPTASDLSLPVSVTLIPRERLLGLPQQLYVTASDFRKDGTYKFDIVVPPGSYDVYLVPNRGQQGCVVPPQLIRGESISGKTTLNYHASKNSDLKLQLHWPKGTHVLDGWTADVIEPLGGRPISTEVTLTTPSDRGTDLVYEIPLVYSTVRQLPAAQESVEFAGDLIRLRPPEGAPLPTIFLDRTGIGLLPGTPTITDFTRYPEPVKLEGQLARAADGAPLTGAVSVVSTNIAGVDDGIIAWFQASVDVTAESDGIFSLELPPGNYLVHAVPGAVVGDNSAGNDSLSSLETEWQIAAGVPFQAGKVLELKPSSVVTGESSFEGAEVRVSASPKTVLPFNQAFGFSPFLPRGRSGLVNSSRFAVSVDTGRFDISVRAPETLGFGWFVKPGVEVTDAPQDLGRVSLKAPSALRGTTTGLFVERDAVVSKVIGSCSVRAYAYLDKDFAYTRDSSSAVSVVQVAETRSDEQGAFRLLVPSSLAAPN